MPIRLDIVTAERVVFSEDVDEVIAPGIEGQLGILPHHAPLMTTLHTGELRVKKAGEELSMVISGGYLEVRPDRVIVLADVAERAEEIDLARAEEAKKRAHEELKLRPKGVDLATAEASLQRALVRLKVGQRKHRTPPPLI
jgi:F-type H+-transporting ATPase subunit epsilon